MIHTKPAGMQGEMLMHRVMRPAWRDADGGDRLMCMSGLLAACKSSIC